MSLPRAESLKINQLLRAYAYYYGAGLIASSSARYHPQCAKKCRSAVVNFVYDGELLRTPVKWKEAHLAAFCIKEGLDRKEYIQEFKWKEGAAMEAMAKLSFGKHLAIKKESERQTESLRDKYPEPRIDDVLAEKEKQLVRQMEEKERLGY